MDHISTKYDEYVRDYIEQNPCWNITLSDGTDVYQDDGRFEPYSSWIRLSNYCRNNGLYITNMLIRFRDNIRHLPSNKDGYFFCKSAMGCFGYDRTIHLFVVGYLENDIIYTTRWKVPEMLDDGEETRSIIEAGECLIKR